LRNIFLLIRRFAVLLLFIGLQALSISMLVSYSKSHRAKYLELAFEASGRVNKQYSRVTRYFSLAENNGYLAKENERLNNLLKQNFTKIDTGFVEKTITLIIDSNTLTRKYLWREARVINNSVSAQNNYITVERGRLQGVEPDMAVVSPAGIVGIVTDVSDNMCVVMSLLHRKSNTSVVHKNSGVTGILEWNGLNPERLQIRGVPKSTKLTKGDTVVTSNLSLNFPEGMLVGTIAEFKADKEGNNYQVNLKPAANFFSLEFVYIIENLFLKEQQELEKRAKK
jgi:rod shape-determining protein MreC